MITLNIATFRTLFPLYASTTLYPDAIVTMNWDTSTLYISDTDYGILNDGARERAIYLMTAHLFFITGIINSGQIPSMVSQSSIDKISVTLTPPPIKSQYQWWLSLSPYGQQLLALIMSRAVGGFSVGGRNELSAFRKAGGVF